MISAQQLDALDPQMRQAVQSLLAQVQQRDAEIAFKQALIDKLTHEMAVLKRLKFAATSERFASTLAPEQKSLLEETLETDLAELGQEIERERGKAGDKDKTDKKTPKRNPLPPHLPRRDVAHEPTDTACGCGQPMQRIGEDVAEKLDYQPGVFTVERHVRGKWVCRCCEKIIQAPVPAHVIDKGIPTAGLLAHLLVAKFMDHLPPLRVHQGCAGAAADAPGQPHRRVAAASLGAAGGLIASAAPATLQRWPHARPLHAGSPRPSTPTVCW